MSLSLSRLPSLDLVRGFVAVGRRMSITLAAQDLCLTQSAISRQVHALEGILGVKLFVRGHRSIQFTAEGERLFRIADVSVQQLQDVFGTLDTRQQRRPVTLTLSTGVASLWLLPRLSRFQALHPDIDVRVAANNKVLDLKAEGIDLAIRYGPQSSVPPGSPRLFGERLIPVCHPSLRGGRLDSAEAVRRNVLLEFDEPRRPWLQWGDYLNGLGLGGVKPRAVLRFNQYDQVIQAAVAGQGIALGRVALVEAMLKDGRLVSLANPARHASGTEVAYWLVTAQDSRPDVQSVIEWIKAEAEASSRALSELD
jgi:LysR family transcriptional regulator, glycine cleavage system transcriptional activator